MAIKVCDNWHMTGYRKCSQCGAETSAQAAPFLCTKPMSENDQLKARLETAAQDWSLLWARTFTKTTFRARLSQARVQDWRALGIARKAVIAKKYAPVPTNRFRPAA